MKIRLIRASALSISIHFLCIFAATAHAKPPKQYLRELYRNADIVAETSGVKCNNETNAHCTFIVKDTLKGAKNDQVIAFEYRNDSAAERLHFKNEANALVFLKKVRAKQYNAIEYMLGKDLYYSLPQYLCSETPDQRCIFKSISELKQFFKK